MEIYKPGTMIGQYEVVSKPMMGGMGVVYFCLDHENEKKPVALKTFRSEFLPDREARERFLREGTAWVNLGSHPYIVRCYKVEYFEPFVFLVLELIAKEQNMPDASLRSWLIPGRPLPIEQALLFALQIARGMQYATEKIPGFVHRDLKPENILVGADNLPGTSINRLRVTDFGLVKTIVESSVPKAMANPEEFKPNRMQFTRGVGTPLYMAPEQWTGKSVGIFTDIYAFGCILYEMLSGQRAINGKTITELQSSHCEGRLQAIPRNLPTNLGKLITKCCSANSDLRFATWNEVLDELELSYELLNGKLVIPRIESVSQRGEESVNIAWSYNAIGGSYLDMGDPSKAQNYFVKALEIGKTEKEQALMGITLLNLGNSYDRLGDILQGIEAYEQALAIYGDLGNRKGQGVVLGNLGRAYVVLGHMQQGIRYQMQAVDIFHEVGFGEGEAKILVNLGIAYQTMGNYTQAIEYFEHALILTRAFGDRRGEGNALGNLGAVYNQLGNAQKAIEYCKERLALSRAISDRRGESAALGNLANSYAILGNSKKAIDCYSQALAVDHEIGDRRGEGADLSNLGNVYLNLGEVRRALGYYEQALEIAREMGDVNGIAVRSFNMASLYNQQGDHTRALPLAYEAEKIWTLISSPYVEHAKRLIAQLQGK